MAAQAIEVAALAQILIVWPESPAVWQETLSTNYYKMSVHVDIIINHFRELSEFLSLNSRALKMTVLQSKYPWFLQII